MKTTKIVRWVDIDDPAKEVYGVKARFKGKWMDITHTGSPCFFPTIKEAIKFAKEVEQKILNEAAVRP